MRSNNPSGFFSGSEDDEKTLPANVQIRNQIKALENSLSKNVDKIKTLEGLLSGAKTKQVSEAKQTCAESSKLFLPSVMLSMLTFAMGYVTYQFGQNETENLNSLGSHFFQTGNGPETLSCRTAYYVEAQNGCKENSNLPDQFQAIIELCHKMCSDLDFNSDFEIFSLIVTVFVAAALLKTLLGCGSRVSQLPSMQSLDTHLAVSEEGNAATIRQKISSLKEENKILLFKKNKLQIVLSESQAMEIEHSVSQEDRPLSPLFDV